MKQYYCGLDLHSNNTFIGILDEEDKRVFQKRSPNDISGILEYLEPFKEAIIGVVVESTFNWYWLVDGLIESGYKVHLAHPPAIVQYKGLKNQDDKLEMVNRNTCTTVNRNTSVMVNRNA